MITYTPDVPQPLVRACEAWCQVYRLEGWRIAVEMADNFADDGEGSEVGAETSMEEPLRSAVIAFRRGISDEDSALNAAHEFVHIAHSGVDHAVARIVQLLPKRDQEMAQLMYRDALERYVVDTTHLITRGALWKREQL